MLQQPQLLCMLLLLAVAGQTNGCRGVPKPACKRLGIKKGVTAFCVTKADRKECTGRYYHGRKYCEDVKCGCCVPNEDEATTHAPTTPSPKGSGCNISDGFFFIPPPSSQCLKFFNNETNWFDARDFCEITLGLKFPQITNAVEVRRFLVEKFGGTTDDGPWVWLNAQGDGTVMRWQGGTKAKIDNGSPLWWYNDQPSNHITSHWCLVMLIDAPNQKTDSTGPYYTQECDSLQYTMCEKPLG